MKKKFAVLFLSMLILVFSSACSSGVEGVWYEVGENPDDSNNQLILSEDGMFIYGSYSGYWDITDDILMLTTTWDSECMTIEGDCLIDSDGEEWTQDYDAALDLYYEQEAEEEAERIAEAEAEAQAELDQKKYDLDTINNEVAGTYIATLGYAYRGADYKLVLNSDGSYKYTCNDLDEIPLEEVGVWSICEDTYDRRNDGTVIVEVDLVASSSSEGLAEYEEKEGADAVLTDLILYYDSEDGTMHLDGDGLGYSTGVIFVPPGVYYKE